MTPEDKQKLDNLQMQVNRLELELTMLLEGVTDMAAAVTRWVEKVKRNERTEA